MPLQPTVDIVLHVQGTGSVNELAAQLSDIPDVHAVITDDANTAVA